MADVQTTVSTPDTTQTTATPTPPPSATPSAAPVVTPTQSVTAPPVAAPTATTAAIPAAPDKPQPLWPGTWRQTLAGEDAKLLERLQRFTSPKDILTSYRALEQRLSSGELKSTLPFPKEGTPEQQKQWREENGLPEKPEAYDLKFDSGLVIGDEDKPWVNSYLKAAHDAHIPTSHVKASLQWYADWKASQAEVREQADSDIARKTVDALRVEWGNDYRTNINGIEALLATAPKGVADVLKNARGSDQNPLFSNPDVLRFFAHLFRQILPVTTLTGGTLGDEKGIDAELSQIRSKMATDRKAYNADPALQARYRQLLEAKERMAKRAA